MDEIEEEFQTRNLTNNGLLILQINDAIQLIIKCEIMRRIILGIDGFYIKPHSIQPSLAHSIDYSGVNKKTNLANWKEAIQFITEEYSKDNELSFEVVYSK